MYKDEVEVIFKGSKSLGNIDKLFEVNVGQEMSLIFLILIKIIQFFMKIRLIFVLVYLEIIVKIE